jgi:hypothetical protein
MSKVRFADFISANIPSVGSDGGPRRIRTLSAAAADHQNGALIKQLMGMARNLGVDLAAAGAPDGVLDMNSVNAQLANSKRGSVTDRIALKTLAAQLRLCD